MLALLIFFTSSIEISSLALSATRFVRTLQSQRRRTFPIRAHSSDSTRTDTTQTLDDIKESLIHFNDQFCDMFTEGPDATDPRQLSVQERARERLLLARIDNLSLSGVTCSSHGSVAGVGLFATCDINKGEVITFYPCDALVHLPTNGVVFGPHVPQDAADPDMCFGDSPWLDYSLQEDKDYAIIGKHSLWR